MTRLMVNGKTLEVEVDPATPLLWALREQVGLTGTKYGCGVGACGSCTVLVDGAETRSCVTPVSAVEGKKITTIEGLADKDVLTKVQKAWIEHDVPQCGYCQPGMIMTAAALLAQTPKPSAAEIDQAMSNLCRCGTHKRVREAMLDLAGGGDKGGDRHGS